MTGHDDRQPGKRTEDESGLVAAIFGPFPSYQAAVAWIERERFRRLAFDLFRGALPDADTVEVAALVDKTAAEVMLARQRLDEDGPSEPLTGPESPSAGPDA